MILLLKYSRYISLLAIVIIIAIMLLPVHQISGAGNTYYVAKTGNNSNAGTLASPWLTIQKAASTMVAGDTVYIKAGIYNEQVIPATSGNSSNWIKYKAYPGDTVIIDGTGVDIGHSVSGSTQGLIYINGKNYIEIDGFSIVNATCHGVSIYQNCDHITLKNLYIAETGACGVFCSSTWNSADLHPTNILIDGVECYHTNGDHDRESITMVCVDGFEVKNCKIHDTIFNGELEWPCQNGINPQGCKNGSIHDNEVYRVMDGIYIGAHFNDPTSSNIDIYNNFVHDCYWPTHNLGIGLTVGVETVEGSTISDINFYNNIVTGNFIGFYDDLMGDNNFYVNFRLINNTFYNNESTQIYIKKTATYHSNCVVRNNIIYAPAGAYGIQYADYANGGVIIDYNLLWDGDITIGGTLGSNYIRANPLFVTNGSNFKLQANSPAINTGTDSQAPSFDYDGNSRPQIFIYDIGAYEYVSVVPTTTPTPTPTATPTSTPTPTPTVPPTSPPPTTTTPATTIPDWKIAYTPRATPTGDVMESNGGVVLWAILPVAVLAFAIARIFKSGLNPIKILALIIFMAIIIYAANMFLGNVTF